MEARKYLLRWVLLGHRRDICCWAGPSAMDSDRAGPIFGMPRFLGECRRLIPLGSSGLVVNASSSRMSPGFYSLKKRSSAMATSSSATSTQKQELYEQIVDALNAVFGIHPGYRAVHAKGVVCEGTFTPT